ncbi:complement factor H-related protein 4-like isoform X2 [Oreochromis aureus]|uniref:complement factor H-related protein 4-like isoform X2 n=1 Tax=Oreochromis aureus TaxID=47969 RepID=UPI0019543047|nr:complement factor H-related protein 4-like isoform X2 [Oreochromis aureus]
MHAITKSSILFLCICALTSVTSQEVTCSRPQDRALSSRQSWRWWLNKLGDTVRYTCRSGYRSTGGVTQATCTRDGWEPNPLCQEIKCRRQQFRNADIIGNIQAEYRYNDRVQYNCRRGYKGNFTLICREDGWHGSSECTEIKCELTLPPLPGTTYEPAYRNRFSPGEKVTVTCGERYWIVGTRTPSVETTCNEDGEWTVRPVCQEVTCSRPHDRLLSYWEVSWHWEAKKLGDTVRYTCRSGYKRKDGVTQATCTRDGWEPNPLCQEIKCRRQHFNNADIIGKIQAEYRHNDRVQYNCRRGYKGSFTLICREDGWHGSNVCTEIKCELTLPPLPGTTFEPANRNRFSPGEKVTVTCGERYWIVGTRTPSVETTCNEDEEWTVRPVCQVFLSFQRLHAAVHMIDFCPTGRSLGVGGQRNWVILCRYTCRSGYKRKDGVTQATCTRDGWEPNPLCQAQQCPSINVPSNVDVIGDAEEATHGNVVQFSCKSSNHILTGAREIYCDENGDWKGLEDGNPKCDVVKCEAPRIENGLILGDIKEYNEHEILNYECNPPYKRAQELPSRCTKNGDRTEWIPTPECEEIKCELTLPPLRGTTYEPAYRNRFSPGETVRVTCGERYWIVGTRTLSVETTCKEDGEWTVRPVCQEVTCSRPHDRLLSYWEVSWRGWSKKLGDTVRYTCRSGYKRKDGVTQATCTRDGWEPNPLCQEIPPCGTPPALEDGDTKTAMKEHYSHNETVEYMCQSYYIMEGEPYKTCLYGPCIVNEDEMSQHNITLKSSSTKYLVHDEIIEFRCTRGLSTGTVAMRQRCNSGVLVLPTCRE